MIFKTEEEVADWLRKQKEEDEKMQIEDIFNEDKREYSGYNVQNDEEWKEILKYHHISYYPRFDNNIKKAEDTYLAIRSYFDKNPQVEKPSFCTVPTKVKKLEERLENLKSRLLLVEDMPKKEEREIKQKIKWIEKKLYIRKY